MENARWGTKLRLGTAVACIGIAVATSAAAEARSVRGSALAWGLAGDMRIAPEHANPNPDSLGNARVWSFLESATLAHRPDR
jgi:hypothetical protein